MASLAFVSTGNVIEGLALGMFPVVTGNACSDCLRVIEDGYRPRLDLVAIRTFGWRGDVVRGPSGGCLTVVAAETVRHERRVVNVDLTPFACGMAQAARLDGLRMVAGFSRRHAAVVTLLALRWHAGKHGSRMARLARDRGMGTIEGKAGLPVMIEIAVDLDVAVDLFSRGRLRKPKAEQS